MLTHPTHERLIALGLPGMAKSFQDQRSSPDLAALSFEERVGIMADREAAERDTKRVTARLKFASLRQDACVEDIDLRTPRGLDRTLLARLVAGDWIDRHQNLLISGPTESGSYCSSGHHLTEPRYSDADRRTADADDGEHRRHARLRPSQDPRPG